MRGCGGTAAYAERKGRRIMSSIVTSTVQLDPNFTDPPKIQYFPPENSGGDFFSIWWGHGMTLILSPQQIHSLRDAILSSPEAVREAGGEGFKEAKT